MFYLADNKRFEAKITADITNYSSNMDKVAKKSDEVSKKIREDNDKVEKDIKRNSSEIKESNDKIKDSNNKLADNFGVNQEKIKREQEEIQEESEDTAEKIKDDNEKIQDSNEDVGKSYEDLEKKTSNVADKLKKTSEGLKKAGSTLTKALTVPIMAGVGALGVLDSKFQDSYNYIRIGTGATGEALEGLNNSFRNVLKQVPASMSDVSLAIADLNTRTGLAGKELEDLALQFLNLSAITGEDLSSSIISLTRVFGDWGIEGKDYGKTLDYIFKVSQTTGISVSKLSEQVVTMGTRFRNAGWELEDALAILGRFEKEGVSTEKAMSGVNIALNNLSRAGVKDLKKGFKDLLKEIETMNNETEAYNKTIEYFGAQAGPDMFDTIRAGKLDVDELRKSMDENGETINGVRDETMTFSESMKVMGNQLAVVFEPLGRKLRDAVLEMTPVFEEFVEKITNLVDWFMDLDKEHQELIITIGGILVALGPVLSLAGELVGIFASLAVLGMAFGGGVALGCGLVIAVLGVIIGLLTFIGSILITGVDEWWGYFCEGAVDVGKVILLILATIGSVFADLCVFLYGIGTMICDGIIWVGEFIIQTIGSTLNGLIVAIGTAGVIILSIIASPFILAFETIKGVFNSIVEAFKGVVSLLKGDTDGFKEHFGNAFDSLCSIGEKTWETLKKLFKNGLDSLKGFMDFEWDLPKIKIPKFKWTGSFSLNPLSVPMLDIQWMSKGGIFKRPTALGGIGVGDKHNGIGSNAEAVLPIDKLPELLGLDKERDSSVVLHIENFNNNRKQDVEQLINEIEFAKRRKRGAY